MVICYVCCESCRCLAVGHGEIVLPQLTTTGAAKVDLISFGLLRTISGMLTFPWTDCGRRLRNIADPTSLQSREAERHFLDVVEQHHAHK
jgi:hypothetical protein